MTRDDGKIDVWVNGGWTTARGGEEAEELAK